MKDWFSIHVVLGTTFALLLSFHTNFFHLQSLNGKFAFYSILVVILSGIVGRYLLRRVHGNELLAKIFRQWHVAHVPVIYMALLFVLVHIYAIHVY